MTDNLIKSMYVQRNLKGVARKLNAISCILENTDTEFEDINILLVEDNPIDIQMICMLIGKLGANFKILTINNGNEAQQFLTMKALPHPNFIPDLIIMDLSLPGIQGKELLDIILREQYLQWLPVIVTSSDFHNIDKESYETRGLLFLQKPYSQKQLFESISKKLCLTINNELNG